MNIRIFFPILFFIPLVIIQLTIVPLISLEFVTPNLIVVLLVIYTLNYGQIYGTILGFILGLLFDLISGGLLGSSMFALTATGFICGYFYNEKNEDIKINSQFLLVVFLSGTIASFLVSLLYSDKTNLTIFNLIFYNGIFPGLYTTIVAFPYWAFKKGSKL